jgi:3-deoxy-7-phosphoheptulonate synthase
MMVIMKVGANSSEIEHVVQRIQEAGFGVHLSEGRERTIIGVLGSPIPDELLEMVETLPGVEQAMRITKRYKLASREFHPEDTVVKVGDLAIGSSGVVVMAGPCSVESEEQTLATARAVAAAGARVLRGGAFKPRTSPYLFRGLGEAGLKILAKAREETGLKIVTEVMSPLDVPLVAEYADILQIGARNMQNYNLLEEAARSGKPVLLKRGLSATIEEWLLAAEYVLSQGNWRVMLCERGIRTFETSTRNTMDISAIPLVKRLSHLPVIADPSHGTGKWYLVAPMALASVAAGADGLLIEVHPNPDHALSDGAQSLNFQNFELLMPKVRLVAQAIGRSVA